MRGVGTVAAVAAILSCWTAPAWAAPEPIELLAEQRHYPVVGRAQVLEDAAGHETVESLHGGARAEAWKPLREALPNFGFTRSRFWIRMRLRNSTSAPVSAVLSFRYPLLDYVNVYVEQADGGFRAHHLGDRVPYSERAIRHTKAVSIVTVGPGEQRWLYASVQTSSSMQLAFTLDSFSGFVERTSRERLFYGAYYGIMIAMVLYNLFLFMAIRNTSYLIYVSFVAMFTATQLALDGVSARYLFAEAPGLANEFTTLTIAACQPLAILFTQNFLETRERAPRVHKALTIYLLLGVGAVVLALVASYSVSIRVGAALSIVSAVVSEVVGILIWRRGHRAARFFVLAWTALVLGTVVYALTLMGLLPANAFTLDSQRIGGALEVTLLSFALGDRINILEAEREAAQARAIAMGRDLALSGAVQQLFLPPDAHVRAEDLELVGFYRPAAQCGGDWWWHERTEDGKLLVVLGDVTGHGAAAAMLTGAIATAFRTLPADVRGDPDTVLRGMDRRFRELAAETEKHMTMAAFTVDTSSKTLRVCNAGSPPVFVMSGERVTPLIGVGSLLGVDELVLGEATHRLQPGDRVFAFSDGLPELRRANGRLLGYAGVKRMLENTARLSAVEARDAIVAALDSKLGDNTQEDDYSFVIIDIG